MVSRFMFTVSYMLHRSWSYGIFRVSVIVGERLILRRKMVWTRLSSHGTGIVTGTRREVSSVEPVRELL